MKIKLPLVLLSIILLSVVLVLSYIFFISDTGRGVCKTYAGAKSEQCTGDYVGLSLDEAVSKAKENGLVPKVETIDGVEQGMTDENIRPIFLEIEDEVVVRAHF